MSSWHWLAFGITTNGLIDDDSSRRRRYNGNEHGLHQYIYHNHLSMGNYCSRCAVDKAGFCKQWSYILCIVCTKLSRICYLTTIIHWSIDVSCNTVQDSSCRSTLSSHHSDHTPQNNRTTPTRDPSVHDDSQTRSSLVPLVRLHSSCIHHQL